MAAWYYSDGTERFGPVEASEIERLIAEGQVTATSLVWREGLEGWVEAQTEFPAAAQGGTSTPPPVAPPSQPYAAQSQNYGSHDHAGGGLGPDGLYVGAPSRSFGEAISTCFSKYATFKGRASRSEYWFFVLFQFVVGLVTAGIDIAIFGLENEVSPLNSIASLAMFLPALAVTWRRLHDTDRSGWWIGGFYLAIFVTAILVVALFSANPGGSNAGIGVAGILGIVFIGYAITMLVFLCQKGTLGPNRFG